MHSGDCNMSGQPATRTRALTLILPLLLTMYSVATLSTQQTIQQVPLSTQRKPFGEDGYTYSINRWSQGLEVPGDTFQMNVGDNAGILYTMMIYNENGTLLCSERLSLAGPPAVDPSEAVFSSSLYTIASGGVTPNTFPPLNPFDFVPWYGGDVEVSIEGYACTTYHPGLIESTDTLQVLSAAVTPDMDPAKTFCPSLPEVIGDGFINMWNLQWSKDRKQPCEFAFDIQNNLDRSASFGLIQVVQNWYVWITIDGQDFSTSGSAGAALLDLEAVTGPIALEATSGDIGSGTKTTLAFGDAPSAMIGHGCWTSPSWPYDGDNTELFDSLGFTYSFQTFIMQDWDKTDGGKSYQAPIGGQSVLEWTLTARADWSYKNGFQVNADASKVTGPSILLQPASFDPSWTGNTLQSIQRAANFNWKTGCYDFIEDPVPPPALRQRKSQRTPT